LGQEELGQEDDHEPGRDRVGLLSRGPPERVIVEKPEGTEKQRGSEGVEKGDARGRWRGTHPDPGEKRGQYMQ
jgi:hypothetical protein